MFVNVAVYVLSPTSSHVAAFVTLFVVFAVSVSLWLASLVHILSAVHSVLSSFHVYVASPYACPSAGISSCASNTSLHTLQCFPSVFPAVSHVGSIASSITSVCAFFAIVFVSLLISLLHTVQYITSS